MEHPALLLMRTKVGEAALHGFLAERSAARPAAGRELTAARARIFSIANR
jgi:hypothetical protein